MRYIRNVSIAALMLFCASCGGGSGDGISSADQEPAARKVKLVPAPSPTPTPSATATTSITMAALPATGLANLVQLDPIPSNFDTAAELVPVGASPSMAPDSVGAFRMTCKPSHNAYDDPIVFPGQPGKSHLHTFFGNTMADAFSTYASLRTTGESTCHSKLNRSAYWVPALMNGRGKVVMPDWLTVYYKRYPSNSPLCTQQGKACVGLPRGLRMVFGRSMTDPNAPSSVWFNCDGAGVSAHYATMAEAARNCPSGSRLGAINEAPSCWNGSQLDSADHRSHLAFWVRDPNTGAVRCPDTHPYIIPSYTLATWYETDDTLDRSGSTDPNLQTWYFASDRMPGMANKVPGSTVHADWFGAWDDVALATWETNCIGKLLSCNTGDLGNGTAMKTYAGFTFTNSNRLVDPPVQAVTAMLCSGKSKLRPLDRDLRRGGRKQNDDGLSQRTLFADLWRRWMVVTERRA